MIGMSVIFLLAIILVLYPGYMMAMATKEAYINKDSFMYLWIGIDIFYSWTLINLIDCIYSIILYGY
jgi:hypothetical protein